MDHVGFCTWRQVCGGFCLPLKRLALERPTGVKQCAREPHVMPGCDLKKKRGKDPAVRAQGSPHSRSDADSYRRTPVSIHGATISGYGTSTMVVELGLLLGSARAGIRQIALALASSGGRFRGLGRGRRQGKRNGNPWIRPPYGTAYAESLFRSTRYWLGSNRESGRRPEALQETPIVSRVRLPGTHSWGGVVVLAAGYK